MADPLPRNEAARGPYPRGQSLLGPHTAPGLGPASQAATRRAPTPQPPAAAGGAGSTSPARREPLHTCRQYGVPVELYGDRLNLFQRNDAHWTLAEELQRHQEPTHFGRMLGALGIGFIQAHSPRPRGASSGHQRPQRRSPPRPARAYEAICGPSGRGAAISLLRQRAKIRSRPGCRASGGRRQPIRGVPPGRQLHPRSSPGRGGLMPS
jgi:hypothetical protein